MKALELQRLPQWSGDRGRDPDPNPAALGISLRLHVVDALADMCDQLACIQAAVVLIRAGQNSILTVAGCRV